MLDSEKGFSRLSRR